MKLYASMVINGREGWGDSIPVLWICESLFNKHAYKITLWDGGSRGLARARPIWKRFIRKLLNISNEIYLHRQYIEKPHYIESFVSGPEDVTKFDKVLVTHHAHKLSGDSWASPGFREKEFGGLMTPGLYRNGYPDEKYLIKKDINAETLNLFLLHNFQPTLPKLNNPKNDLFHDLPEKYIFLQLRRSDHGKKGSRNHFNDEEFDSWVGSFIDEVSEKWGLPILNLSDQVVYNGNATIYNCQHLRLWEKIHIAAKGVFGYVAHSGFGMICGAYQGYETTKIINISPITSGNMPPIGLFSNVGIKASVREFTSNKHWIDQHNLWEFDYEETLHA